MVKHSMDLNRLSLLVERLRKATIGEPVWNDDKEVFEYENQTLEVVVILKLIRAVQGIKSQLLLCREGLFIDMSALFRCVNDCSDEIWFLLEQYPEQSKHVTQFVDNFFEHTIDSYDSADTPSVLKKKIHSSKVRQLTGQTQDEPTRKMLDRVHKAFCGYIHANYSHIMQSYGGVRPNLRFDLLGTPSENQKLLQVQIVQESYTSIVHCVSLICQKFGQDEIAIEVNGLLADI